MNTDVDTNNDLLDLILSRDKQKTPRTLSPHNYTGDKRLALKKKKMLKRQFLEENKRRGITQQMEFELQRVRIKMLTELKLH